MLSPMSSAHFARPSSRFFAKKAGTEGAPGPAGGLALVGIPPDHGPSLMAGFQRMIAAAVAL